MRDEIVIYWSPVPFEPYLESWNFLYAAPVNIYSKLVEDTDSSAPIRFCPATKTNMKKIFSFNSTIDDEIDFSSNDLAFIDQSATNNSFLPYKSKVALRKPRQSSYPGHINVSYNLSWYFFASEPVVARMTAPYYPAVTPTKNALFATGEFDIGQWFRPFNLDYHIPYDSKSFKVNAGDPLFFLELFTDKQIVFKRFVTNDIIKNISFEMSDAPKRYGPLDKLVNRYKMFNMTKTREILLHEIQKNAVE
jgi:hypothetical protein